jgi:hypothetical protein
VGTLVLVIRGVRLATPLREVENIILEDLSPIARSVDLVQRAQQARPLLKRKNSREKS